MKIKSLLWKEWHEQRWKAAFAAAILIAFTAIGLMTRMLGDGEIIIMSGIFAAIIYPVLVTMGLVATERADRTFGSLMVLPERPWRILAVKVVVGMAVLGIPIVLAATVAFVMAGRHKTQIDEYLMVYFSIFWIGLQFMIWTLAFGIGQPSAARVGLVGVGVFIGWILWWNLFDTYFFNMSDLHTRPLHLELLWLFHPWCSFGIQDKWDMLRVSRFGVRTLLIEHIITMLVLFFGTAWRFGRMARRVA